MQKQSSTASIPEKNPAALGFSPAASASTNVTALQATLDGGGTVVIDRPGVYDLNATILLDSDTHLRVVTGVVFRKVTPYCNVLINRGALTRQYNENITIDGLEISVNDQEAMPTLVYGLRAQVGFFYVKNLTLRNFTCIDGKEKQYLIYIVTWENLLIENTRLAGDKDGIKLNNGHDAIIRNLDLNTYDDGTSLCGTDYASTLLEVGDVYNVRYINVIDRQYKNIFGRTCLILNGSWADYEDGNDYGAGDFCLHEGSLYQVTNDAGFVATASVAPAHRQGIVTGTDGIAWRYVQPCNFRKTNVYNISFENCRFEKSGNIIASWITPDWYYRDIYGIHRNFYPGTEKNAAAWGISLVNCTVAGTMPQVLVNLMGNIKDVSFDSCTFDNPFCTLVNIDPDSANDELAVIVRNCRFSAFAPFSENSVAMPEHQECPILRQDIDDTGKLFVVRNGSLLRCTASGNTWAAGEFECTAVNGSTLELANMDLPLRDRAVIE